MSVFFPAAKLPIGPPAWREDRLRPELTRPLIHGEMVWCLRTFLDLVRSDPIQVHKRSWWKRQARVLTD